MSIKFFLRNKKAEIKNLNLVLLNSFLEFSFFLYSFRDFFFSLKLRKENIATYSLLIFLLNKLSANTT